MLLQKENTSPINLNLTEMFEFLIDFMKGMADGYLNLFLGLFVGGGICVGIFAVFTKIWEWFEEKDSANSWLAYPLVAIIISAIAWVLDSLF